MMPHFKRRIAQVLALVVLCLGFANLGWQSLSTWQVGQEEHFQSLEALDRMRSIAAYAKSWVPIPVESQDQPSRLFLPDAAASVVDANLLTSIKDLAAKQGIEISRTSSSPPRYSAGMTWHDVTVDVSGTNAALLQFISALETSKPYLFVERLQIQSSVQPGVVLQTEPILSAQLTISGATQVIAAATATQQP